MVPAPNCLENIMRNIKKHYRFLYLSEVAYVLFAFFEQRIRTKSKRPVTDLSKQHVQSVNSSKLGQYIMICLKIVTKIEF